MNEFDPRASLKLHPTRPFITARSAVLADVTLLAAVAGVFVLLVT
jgi:hypothetical protein